jgi:PIN domain nuclease of toxin-antitoxin system
MTLAVLDSSALMALMLNEPGSDVVAASLDGAISAVNLAEVGAKMLVRGLSLGDRTCFALAGQTGRRALTTDQEWAEVGLDLDIRLIR